MKKFTIYNLQFTVKFVLFIFSFYVLHSIFYIQAFAAEDIEAARIHPASPIYFLKVFKESLELKFTSNPDKGLKYIELSNERIGEVKSLIAAKREDLIPPVLEKYWSSLGKTLNPDYFKDQSFAPQLIDEVGDQINGLLNLYAMTDNFKAKISIRSVIYRVSTWNKALLERLTADEKVKLLGKVTANQLTICSFLSKEASSLSINKTEKDTLSQRAQFCESSF